MLLRTIDAAHDVHLDACVRLLQRTFSAWCVGFEALDALDGVGGVVAGAAPVGLGQSSIGRALQHAELEGGVVGTLEAVSRVLAADAAGAGTHGDASALWGRLGKTTDPALTCISKEGPAGL